MAERYESNIKPISELRGYEISEGDPDIRSWELFDKDNNKIGKVEDLLVDTNTDKVAYILASFGGILSMGGDSTAIPLHLVRLDKDNHKVMFYGTSDDLKSAPRYHKDVTDYGLFNRYWDAVTPMAGQKMGVRTPEEYETAGHDVEKNVDVEAQESKRDIEEGEHRL